MKNLIFILVVILGMGLNAQTSFDKPKIFVRVYDMQGNKIGKGKISAISENSLQLSRHKKTADFPLSNIGQIRTKRSIGNNFATGAMIGAVAVGILGAVFAEPDSGWFSYTAGEGAGAGIIAGGILGAGVGGLSIVFKNAKSYRINANPEQWKVFMEAMVKR
ncbi:hypothetical protein [Christiangramia sabulilitoris]|uniref:Uncharacterized protein n=1 Tax=Christiangramia sabulilitoris TaxID=2583991 RepID=A0A550I116_9FLAO|nr:hypothetical protein [Christiangramia sabulilitoris]TRO64508.1 hypothetical protein FGM01_13545 [Christiangramia sabulilitoris]